MAGIEYPVRLQSVETYLVAVHGSARELGVDELDVLTGYVEQIVDEVENAWPLDTSTSRDAFTFLVEGHAGRIGFVIENDTDYASFVHYAGTPAEPELWTTLIPARVNAHAASLIADLKLAIDDTERVLAEHAAARAAAPRGTKRDHLTANQVLARSWRTASAPRRTRAA